MMAIVSYSYTIIEFHSKYLSETFLLSSNVIHVRRHKTKI